MNQEEALIRVAKRDAQRHPLTKGQVLWASQWLADSRNVKGIPMDVRGRFRRCLALAYVNAVETAEHAGAENGAHG